MSENICEEVRPRSTCMFRRAAYRVTAISSAVLFLICSQTVASGQSRNADDTSAAAMVARGEAIFKSHTCSTCHGEAARGTVAAPALVGMAKRRSPEQLKQILHHRTRAMIYGGMPPVSVSQNDMAALIAYLSSL